MGNFLNELRRRNVFRVAAAYVVMGWLIVQVAAAMENAFGLPAWFDGVVAGLLILGFPVAVLFAWAFELTPEGIKRTEAVPEGTDTTAKSSRALDYVIVAGLVIVIAVILTDRFLVSGWHGHHESTVLTAAQAPDKSVAVLPFVNMSADPDQEYFSDGISEEILNALVRLNDLKVAGRTSSFAFKDKNEDLRVIGEALDVAYLLEGSVRKQGERVRITAQLVKAADGFHMWSETFDRTLTDIFAIQDEISAAVANALEVQLLHKPALVPRTENSESYEAYLLGRHELVKRTPESLNAAIAHFKAAIALDDKYAPAYAALGFTYAIYNHHVLNNREAPLDLAAAAAERALELDPNNATALAVLGTVNLYLWHFDEARNYAEKSVAVSPNSADAWNLYGDYLSRTGDLDKAIKAELRAFELDPLNAVAASEVSAAYVFRGRIAESLEYAKKAREMNPDHQVVNTVNVIARFYAGDLDGAEQSIKEFETRAPGHPFIKTLKARLAALRGDAETLNALHQQALAAEQTEAWPPPRLFFIFYFTGDLDRAAHWFDIMHTRHDLAAFLDLMWLPEQTADSPAMQALWAKPDFQALANLRRSHGQYQTILAHTAKLKRP